MVQASMVIAAGSAAGQLDGCMAAGAEGWSRNQRQVFPVIRSWLPRRSVERVRQYRWSVQASGEAVARLAVRLGRKLRAVGSRCFGRTHHSNLKLGSNKARRFPTTPLVSLILDARRRGLTDSDCRRAVPSNWG